MTFQLLFHYHCSTERQTATGQEMQRTSGILEPLSWGWVHRLVGLTMDGKLA